MFQSLALAALSLSAGVYAQQAGTLTAETHPSMPWSSCTASGCKKQSGSVVLDANWRWVHSTSDSTNCYTGQTWDKTLCPDPKTCAKNCALDGADYEGTYGIDASGDGSLSLTLVTGSNVGSRVYLLAGENDYEMFHLKNREFTFDVDVSNLPCGLNGALYFVEMDKDGGKSEYSTNKAGAKYGTGYCDSQCPQDIKFIDGLANIVDWTPSSGDPNSGTGSHGSCCNEMDVWEANSVSAAFTPHVCSKAGQTMCTGNKECGAGNDRYTGTCDKDGCDFNSYRMGNDSFYGKGDIVDTSSKFTVVTKFITDDGTDSGKLSAIRRLYVQGGKVIHNSKTDIKGIDTTNEITDGYCKQQKKAFGDTDSFEARGGLATMGDGFERGMALVLSVWDDYAAHMLWLDSSYPASADKSKPGVKRGTCSTSSGVPSDVNSNSPDASVTFSNIKFGTLGSTYKH